MYRMDTVADPQIAAGQNSKMIDHLFTGNVLGHESDIADGRLRGYEFRSLNNIVGDYYVSPRFLETVAVHSLSRLCHLADPCY